MPDISEVAASLEGIGGMILDGLVEIQPVGKWSHRRYSDGHWVTTIDNTGDLPAGTYRLRCQFGRWVADMPRAAYDGQRFTGTSVVMPVEEAV